MTILEVISGSEAFHKTALSFMKEFAERRSYSEITDDYQEFVMLTMVGLLSLSSIIHWRAPGPIRYAHWIWITKLLYAMKIYIFCDQCDQEGPRNPIVVCFNLTRKEETRIHRCAQFWCPSLYNQRSHFLLKPLDKI